MASQRMLVAILGLCGGGVLWLIAAEVNSNGDPARGPAEANPTAAPSSNAVALFAPKNEEARAPNDGLSEAIVDVVEQADSSPVSAARTDALDANHLRTALEDSLYGQIDPNIFLQAALALTELEVGDEALEALPPEITGYPILGTPEGISAELWIGNPPKEVYGSARSYVIRCESPEGLYVVEGAARSDLKTQVSIWTDPHGQVKNFGVLTEMNISGETMRLGLPLDSVPTGLLYSYDVDTPFEVAGQQNGLINGQPGPWRDSSLVVSGDTLRSEDLELLSVGLLSTHNINQN